MKSSETYRCRSIEKTDRSAWGDWVNLYIRRNEGERALINKSWIHCERRENDFQTGEVKDCFSSFVVYLKLEGRWHDKELRQCDEWNNPCFSLTSRDWLSFLRWHTKIDRKYRCVGIEPISDMEIYLEIPPLTTLTPWEHAMPSVSRQWRSLRRYFYLGIWPFRDAMRSLTVFCSISIQSSRTRAEKRR